MANIRMLPSGRFNVQIRVKGSPNKTATFDDMEAAKAWATANEASDSNARQTQTPTFRELADAYCLRVLKGRPSQPMTMKRLERIASFLPTELQSITKSEINNFRLTRLNEVSSVTCRDELQLINRVYRWAHSEMMIDREKYPSPCKDVPMPKGSKPRNKVVSSNELKLLMKHLSPIMREIVEVAFETAMRLSEIVKLTARDVNLSERYISVIDGKTGDRLVPLTKRALELLRMTLERCLTPDSRLYVVCPHSVSTAVRRARKEAGLSDDIRLHQLRHTRISMVARKGFNQAQIMMVSGHRDGRSVQRYTHLNVTDVIRLLD